MKWGDKMSRLIVRIGIVTIVICSVLAVVIGNQPTRGAGAALDEGAWRRGLKLFEGNESAKSIGPFRKTLGGVFAEAAWGELKKAVELGRQGKNAEAEKLLRSLFDDEATAARARYELAGIYEAGGRKIEAAQLLHDTVVLISNKGAKYVGTGACRKCHLKQYMSWKKTTMARTFDVLKPGNAIEAKKKTGFDPKKDYTKDPACLPCHTTGYGLPAAYSTEKAKLAKANEGTTCEACHGPGSKYIALHKDVLDKKRKYSVKEFYDAGMFRIDAAVCTTCHNRKNPTAPPDFRFDYEQFKDKGSHENFPLKYRAD